ncbi:MAG: tripartite tricarboxylate transporter substrate binding protein [Burkholderiales bacterium]|nr:tripartite tricarboxylate transporter substrate binding protein [Burkholderiales bacterium]
MRVIAYGCALALSIFACAAGAQSVFPSRPVVIVNPYGPGSATDIAARALAREMAGRFNGNVAVVNREGASGVIGMTSVMTAAADGHTLGYVPMATLTTQPHLNKSSKVNPDTLEPVCGVTENILGIVVRDDSPFKSIGQLVEAARTRSLTYGSPGPNSGPYMGIAPLARQQAIELTHVPYKGDAAALADLLAGNIDFTGSIAASATPFIKSGRLRMLAVMSTSRHPGFPEVPTLVEAGYGITSLSYAGLFAPKGVPEPVLDEIEASCKAAIASAPLRQMAASSNQVLRFQGRHEWTQQVRRDFAKQAGLLKAVGEKVD